MMNSRFHALLGALAILTACGPARQEPPATVGPEPDSAVLEQAARADSVRRHYTQADVDFMAGMIHHHAQAIVMSRLAPTHGAGPSVRTLAARIINAQRDEIASMQRWLRDRGEAVPVVNEDGTVRGMEPPAATDRSDPAQGHAMDPDHAAMDHDAMDHGAMGHSDMAGMLSPEQMAQLRASRGEAFDRLFLTYMIQHHQGAVVMVDELFASPGSGQGDAIFKIASDINVDQQTEIDRMQQMLEELVFGTRTP
jgi:uncharacterized protein (DUF305 family)